MLYLHPQKNKADFTPFLPKLLLYSACKNAIIIKIKNKPLKNLFVNIMKVKLLILVMLLCMLDRKAIAENCDPNASQNTKLYIVSLEEKTNRNIVEKYGKIDYEFKIINAVTAFLTSEQARALRQEAGVKSVEEDQEIQIGPVTQTENTLTTMNSGMQIMAESGTETQWNLTEQGINAENAWNEYNVDGSGVKIAIIDSGVNYNLPDLGGAKYLGGYDYCVTGTGTSCAGEDNDPMDIYGHGTQMATAMLANGTTLSGVAPETQYYAIKIINTSSNSKASILLKALEWADANSDATIIYMGVHSYISTALGNFLTSKHDKFLFIAPTYAAPYSEYPAMHPNVIGVGGHTKDNPQGITADTGNWADVLAPGEKIPTLNINGNTVFADDNVGIAAAQVAGALALMADYNKTNLMDYNNVGIRTALQQSAISLGTGDPREGYGKADAYNSLTLMANDWFIDCNAVFTEPNYNEENIPGYFLGGLLNYKIVVSNNIPIDFTGHKDINNLIITASLRYDSNDSNLPLSTRIFNINLPCGQTGGLLASYNIDSNTAEGIIALDIVIAVGQQEAVIKKIIGAAYAKIMRPCGRDADFITDKVIDFKDFAKLASLWLSECDVGNGYCYGADLLNDGVIDYGDLKVFISYWLCRYP